jgi:hypothetical protein
MPIPPRPTTPPRYDADTDTDGAFFPGSSAAGRTKNVNRTRNGDGFGFKPTLTINVKESTGGGRTAGPAGPGAASGPGASQGTPGADFMSNEDIRAFSEHLRKAARNRAVERSMDAAQLEARLRNIPDASGRMHGSRARARRVTRYLKLIAAGEKAIAKWSTALYSAFEREFEAELIKIGKGRNTPNTSQKFNWR